MLPLLLLLLLRVLVYCFCCCSCCLLVLLVIVCRMAKLVAGSLNLIPEFCFESTTIYFLCTQSCRIYGLDLPTPSEIIGMRGAKAGVSPPREAPLVSRAFFLDELSHHDQYRI